MKRIRTLLVLLFATALGMGIVSCGDDGPVIDPVGPSNPSGVETGIRIATIDASDITDNSATLNGSISVAEGRPDILGFLVGDTENLSVTNKLKDVQVETSLSSFSQTLSGLSHSTRYYYRAYALYNDKYYYGEAKSFMTEKEKEALIKITLVSKNGTSLKVKYEMSSDVDYYYCGRGSSISSTTKYKEDKTFTYSDLKPGKDYIFTAIPYTKDGQKQDAIRATFTTSSSPYSNYVCCNGDFYQITGVTMTTDYGYTGTNTGTNWKLLYLYISSDEFVQFRYGVHEWESVTSNWATGTYNITNSSSYYSYNGFFYNGSRADWFYEGSMTIKKQSGVTEIDFECEGNKNYFGHVEAQ